MYIYIYLSILFSRLVSIIGHYKISSIVPYAILLDGWSLLDIYLTYTSVYV